MTASLRHKKKPVTQLPLWVRCGFWVTQKISLPLTGQLAAYLFSKPIRHNRPKREVIWFKTAIIRRIHVAELNKTIQLYRWGESDRKVLLVHGWSGRGTQMCKLTKMLLQEGYEVWSFDAPAHGGSEGKTTVMLEFIASIREIAHKIGQFEIAIGHSLGGMALLHAAAQNTPIQRLVTIGSGDVIADIAQGFVRQLQLPSSVVPHMQAWFEKKYNQPMTQLDAHKAAAEVHIPTLVIHDKADREIPVQCAQHLTQHLSHGSCFITDGLGHRKILNDPGVVLMIRDWIKGQ